MNHSKLSNRPEEISDQEAGLSSCWIAGLTPCKIGSDIHPILRDGSEQSFTISPEILGPVGIFDGLIDRHLRFIHYCKPVLGHAADFVSTLAEGSQATQTY